MKRQHLLRIIGIYMISASLWAGALSPAVTAYAAEGNTAESAPAEEPSGGDEPSGGEEPSGGGDDSGSGEDSGGSDDSGAGEDYFEAFLTPALEKAEKEGAALYCGEYGVIDVVPPEEAVKWFRDLHAVFERHGIARCLWSYKQMDFGLSDARMDGVREELLKLL